MSASLSIVAFLLGIVEGLTEFIPVSSTGHMIVIGDGLHFNSLIGSADRAELFLVVIQLGAILAVGWYYRQRLQASLFARSLDSKPGKLRTHLAVAFLPAAIFGFLFHKQLKMLLTPLTVAITLIIGGIVIILVERSGKTAKRTTTVDTMTLKDAIVVGCSQILSLIPGTSRSAATIMGGMLGGMERSAATEFSFLLSFPIMIAASVFELVKYRALLTSDMFSTIAIGFVVAFVTALLVVGWLVRFVQGHSFAGFGYYRIAFGAMILVLYSMNFFSN
ncbi:MAG: undecaprenyl-diphosphate phosphatase [Candidatus Kapaibacterium sp.]|jgi:undecaprenyl-diphosphatase